MPITSQRIQVLLAYLALHRTETQPRQRLAFLLWPDSSESQAHTNLRTLLHRLHTVFPQVDHLLQIEMQTITWQGKAALDLDVEDFEQAIRQTNASEAADNSVTFSALERAVSSYGGDLLPECYDEWVLPKREQLRQGLFTALERLILLLEQRRSYAEAIPHARRLVSLDPLNEAACLMLMRLHSLNGDRASALRVYHRCVSALQTELGASPSAALDGEYERLLAATVPPLVATRSTESHAAETLVGRRHEWKRMQAIWRVAASGQARLLTLWGEAGIGKTRLAEDLLSWANRQGVVTAVARCYAAEGDLAYGPVTAFLSAETLQPGIARLTGEWRAELSRLAPDLPAAKLEVRQPIRPLTEGWQRQRLFEALARAVLIPNRPLMLLIDDLQWCDRDTLEWLHFLLRYPASAGVLVIGTIRAEEVSADHALVPLLEALRRESRTVEIALSPLSREETAALAGSVVGRALSPQQNDNLYQETEGNPLFVVEMLRAEQRSSAEMDDSERIPVSSAETLGLPASVRAVVSRRLSQLSPAGRAVLEVAAVIGRSFTFGVVAEAVDLDEDAVVRGVDELWQRRVVREQGSDAYDFTHGKLRAVAYAELSAARQRLLHRRVARALEQVNATNLAAVSGQIALHYQQAGLTAPAVTYYQRAAEFARRLYANDVAIVHLQQALGLLSEQQPEIIHLCDQLGELLHFVGRYEDARHAWRRALDGTPASDPVARAHLFRKLGNAWRDQYHYDEAEVAYDAAETALGTLDADASEAVWFCWGQIKLERMNVLYWLGQVTEMLGLIDQLRLRFEQNASVLQQARLHQISAVALLRANRYDTSARVVEHARAYLQMLAEAGESGAVPAAHFQMGFALLWARDDLAAAEQEIIRALTLAQQSGDVSLEARCLTYLTVIARRRGKTELAQKYAERSLDVAETGQMLEYIGAAYGNLAWLEWHRSELAAARSHGQAALEAWKQLPAGYMFEWIGRLPLIALALAEDNLDEAILHTQVLLDERQKRMPPRVEAALEGAVRAANAQDADACRTYLQRAAASAQQAGYL